MKKIFAFLFLLPLYAHTQNADSLLIVKEVDSLLQVNRDLAGKRKFDEAFTFLDLAEKKSAEAFGKEHALYAKCLFNHGRTLRVQRQMAPAREYYLQALSIQEKVLGKEHLDYVKSLMNLGEVGIHLDRFPESNSSLLEARLILEKANAQATPEYPTILNNLAALYRATGQYEEALQFLIEAKDIREKVLGKENKDYALSLANLATFYKILGQYEKAEQMQLEALGIRERVVGKDDPDYAQSLSNLTNLYVELGQYEKAKVFGTASVEIRGRKLGKEDPDYANSLANLANVFQQSGDYIQAESLLVETKKVREKTYGKEHSQYALVLVALADICMKTGRFIQADSILQEARNVREKVSGKEHPEYAICLELLANLYTATGRFDEAEKLYVESLLIREKLLGKEHPAYSECQDNLAALYRMTLQDEKAGTLLIENNRIKKSQIEKNIAFLSEGELLKNIQLFQKFRQQLYALSKDQIAAFDPVNRAVYDNILFFKGLLQENSRALELSMAAAPDSVREQHSIWRGFQRRLNIEYTKPIKDRKNIAILEAQTDSLEKLIVRSVAGFAESRRDVTWQDVRDKLKPEEAAVEFIHFQYFTRKGLPTDSTFYIALILRHGSTAPIWIPLFEQKQVDALLMAGADRKDEFANRLYTGSALYELIWKPISAYLSGVKTVYFSPSGTLHRINFNAIPDATNTLLAERYQLIQMGSTRHVVVPPDAKINNNNAVLFGGIQYNADTTTSTRQLLSTLPSAADENLVSRGGQNKPGIPWSDLPFTDLEVTNIERMLADNHLKPLVRRGITATEESFKRLGQASASPRILHIATHGFFFPDTKDSADVHSLAFDDQEAAFGLNDNPMLRSGLILAGGNRAWVGGGAMARNQEDGILTAYEINQMNLSNTELVVLSGCETGLGDIQGSEGVYGLQRAFKIAGVKYIIISLWQVPDKQTSQLMTTFYQNWLQKQMPIPDAFRAAQKEMRDRGLEPYKWAGFVLVE